jgi:predicted DCC family thiol-disulfide oxidoreductase YuxK
MRSPTPPMTAPAAVVILFDNDCMLCDGLVKWLVRHDHHARLKFAALQSATGTALLVEYGLPVGFTDSMVVLHNGRAWLQSEGVLQILTALGGWWRVLAVAGRLVPKPLREALYRWIARNRYRWFGHRDGVACALPTPAERAAFLI